MTLWDIARLLRIHQYYKNFLVFMPLVFAGLLLSQGAIERTILGFISLCMVASSGYILNDIHDIEKDRKHPEKKLRPIPSGNVSINLALLTSLTLLLVSILLAFQLDATFTLFVVAYFIITNIYSLVFKQVLFLDIIIIATLFVLRAISGAFVSLPNQMIPISPWLILVPFFLAIFLVAAKRTSNVFLLKDDAKEFSKTLDGYDEQTTQFLFTISTTLLLAFYALYTLFSPYKLLAITIPVVLYAILYFTKKVNEGHVMGRELSHAFKDPRLFISLLIWSVIAFSIIYALPIFS